MNDKLHEVIPRGKFNNLCKTISNIYIYLRRNGRRREIFNEIDVNNEYSYELLKTGINLIINASCYEYFEFIIDFKFYDIMHGKFDLSSDDIAELLIIKKSMIYIYKSDTNKLLNLLNELADNNVRGEILKNFNKEFEVFGINACKKLI